MTHNRVKIRPRLLGSMIIFSSVAMAVEPAPKRAPEVWLESDVLIAAPAIGEAPARFLVAVISDRGQLIHEEATEGDAVLVDAEALGLADGFYRIEVTAMHPVSAADRDAGKGVTRVVQRVRVEGGRIVVDQPVSAASAASSGWLATLVDWVIPAAHAADVVVESSDPQITFDDNDGFTPGDGDDCCEWRIIGNINGDSNNDGTFSINNMLGNSAPAVSVFSINGDQTQANLDAQVINTDGSILFNQSSALMQEGKLVLGTSVSSNNSYVHMVGADLPEISWDDTFNGTQGEIEFDNNVFGFGDTGAVSTDGGVRFHVLAPTDSLSVINNGRVGVGGTVASSQIDTDELTINGDANAQIGFVDPDGSAALEYGGGGPVFTFEKADETTVASIDMTAPLNALALDADGDLGIGTALPSQPVHVSRTAGAQVLVENTTAAVGARTLFRLANAGNTKFEIENTDAANTWAFTNSGVDFRVSLQGSGVVEFRVDNNGDAFLDGTLTQNSDANAKQGVVPVDPTRILDKVARLPVSLWQYKDAPGVNHVGPMAQDFHAAFGLGATDTGISTIDTAGVALAAIQGLNQRLAQQNAQLRAQNLSLEQRLHRLETLLLAK